MEAAPLFYFCHFTGFIEVEPGFFCLGGNIWRIPAGDCVEIPEKLPESWVMSQGFAGK